MDNNIENMVPEEFSPEETSEIGEETSSKEPVEIDEEPTNSEKTVEETSKETQIHVKTGILGIGDDSTIDVSDNRLPYYKRHYLLYGFEEIPAQINVSATRDFLKNKGFGNSSLKQAREGKKLADRIAGQFIPDKPQSHYCDFCGVELVGTEYDVLLDGRERCTTCTRTALKKLEDFKDIYENIKINLQAYFGISVNIPISIEVLNSKSLHAKINKRFIPTSKMSSRVLGYAIKDKNGKFTLRVENGAPRNAAIMTMVHELTHIWQYKNWDQSAIQKMYGRQYELEVYEGMAKWVEIQYAFLIGESAAAIREARTCLYREDEYGRGLKLYMQKYKISEGTRLEGNTPFDDPKRPL